MGCGWLALPWPFWCSAERKCWHCRTGHTKIHTTTTQNNHTEPQRIHRNTSTKLDRMISSYLQHTQGPNTSVQPKSSVLLSHMMALSWHVLLAHVMYEHADWSQNLQTAPHYGHQAPYHTCVTSATSLSCPPFMAACDLHITSTLDLCCTLLCAGEYTTIIGHGKGPSAVSCPSSSNNIIPILPDPAKAWL